jgi:hypothetical protein
MGAGAAIALGLTVISVGPARATLEAVMSCAQSSACLEWDNTKAGDAIKGVSSKGNALHGQTKFNSTGKTAGKSGVLGEDLSSSGTLNAGVSGASINGAGVIGTSTSYNAVEGFSTNSTGVYGQTGNPGGFGVAGRNTATSSGPGAGVYGDGGNNNVGVFGRAAAGNGVYAYSDTGVSLHLNQGSSDNSPELLLQGSGASHDLIQSLDDSGNVVFGVTNMHQVFISGQVVGLTSSGSSATFANSAGDTSPALVVDGGGNGTNDDVFIVADAGNISRMRVTDEGNIIIGGLLYSQGPCNTGCMVGKQQIRSVGAYAPMETEPTIEDNGEATLIDGRADVALDPQFVNVIDASKQYMVSVTPEGDCRGLYVESRSPKGFTVRELQGGRASVAFEYRIVAKRVGVTAPRLPMTTIRRNDRRRLPSRG